MSKFHAPIARPHLLLGGLMLVAMLAPAAAQEIPFIDTAHGTLLIHGNYCGPGNRGPKFRPIDALDRACMHHDSCSPPRGQIPTCGCNHRLHAEADAVAKDPAQPEPLRDTAELVAGTALVLPCK